MRTPQSARIRSRLILTEQLIKARDCQPFADDEHLTVTGRLDQFGIAQVLYELETRYCLELSPGDFQATDFDYVEAITNLLTELP